MSKNIVLCGFMGCGKTTVGKVLSKKTRTQFVDIDRNIERVKGQSIAEIFDMYGESGFREIETQAVISVSKLKGAIISTGGGTILSEKNRKIFKAAGDTIYFLNVPLEKLQKRLKADTKRPLLQVADRDAVIEELYKKRQEVYLAAADVVIDGSVEISEVVENLITILGLNA